MQAAPDRMSGGSFAIMALAPALSSQIQDGRFSRLTDLGGAALAQSLGTSAQGAGYAAAQTLGAAPALPPPTDGGRRGMAKMGAALSQSAPPLPFSLHLATTRLNPTSSPCLELADRTRKGPAAPTSLLFNCPTPAKPLRKLLSSPPALGWRAGVRRVLAHKHRGGTPRLALPQWVSLEEGRVLSAGSKSRSGGKSPVRDVEKLRKRDAAVAAGRALLGFESEKV